MATRNRHENYVTMHKKGRFHSHVYIDNMASLDLLSCILNEKDEDLLLLSLFVDDKIVYNTYDGVSSGRFDLQKMTDDQAKINFRFEKNDILRLATALHLPEHRVFSDRSTATNTESLCMVLRRLAYPIKQVI